MSERGGRVSVEDIASTPRETPPAEPKTPGQDPLTGRDGKLDQHLGRVGKYIGGGPEKAGNIAYIVIVASLVLLIVGAACGAYSQSDKLAAIYDRVVTGAISLITGALGFLFGKSGSQSD
jgi:hypothetical protein